MTVVPQDHKDGKVPFYSWQCITLQLEHREVDLVIPDDQDMNKFLMVIIKAMNTVDGNRNSLNCVQDQLIETKRKN